MASLLRTAVCRLGSNGFSNRLCKVSSITNATQVASITTKEQRVNRPRRPPPYPYEEKNFTSFMDVNFDQTAARFDDNTRLIVVDGPIAAGKTRFAYFLAQRLDMQFIPPCSLDDFFIDSYGFDLRKLDPYIPVDARTCDVEKFLNDPHDENVTAFQFAYYHLRILVYMKAMLHVLSTGQGVVLNRCIYSDFVFMLNMVKQGYVSKLAYKYYKHMHEKATYYLCRPHLVVYLDVPVDIVKKRIIERNVPYEVNSKVLNDKYLSDMEDIYKNKYLADISSHAHVLMYDWSTPGDLEAVVEDITDLDFDNYKESDKKMRDWLFDSTEMVIERRGILHDEDLILNSLHLNSCVLKEMFTSAESVDILNSKLDELRGQKYAPGFNTDMGDKILWKTKPPKEDILKIKTKLKILKERFEGCN